GSLRNGPESARRRPGDWERLDPVDERRQQPRGLFGRDDIGYLAVQFLEHHPDLATSQVGAQAEVRTTATEADMRIGVAGYVEHPWVRKLRLVAIGRAVPQRGLVAGGHLGPVELDVMCEGASHVDHR